jgi:hypothetical protein
MPFALAILATLNEITLVEVEFIRLFSKYLNKLYGPVPLLFAESKAVYLVNYF